MKSNRIARVLDSIRLDILEDIDTFGNTAGAVLFYIEKKGTKHFSDYEIFEPGEPTPMKKNEDIDIISLKDLLWIVACLEYPDASVERLVIYYYLWIRKTTPYKLAQEIGISRQALSQFMNGSRSVPKERMEQIAKALTFEISEFLKEKTTYVFDETDL